MVINPVINLAQVRGQVTKKSLDQLREHQLTGMASAAAGGLAGGGGTSPGAVRKFSSPSAAGQTPGSDTGFGTPSGKKVSRIQSTINRRISSISTRVVAESGLR